MCEKIARLGFEITGIDPSEPSLAAADLHARSSGLAIHYEQAWGESLPYREGSFDVVFCFDVLEHHSAGMEAQVTIRDVGPQPHSFDIEHATKENTVYRAVAWSGRYLQVTLMSIPAGEDIGLEAHPETDQFLRIDGGRGRVEMGAARDELTFQKEVSDGWCVLVPAGTWHNITNTGATLMQVYTIYAPAHHKPGKVHATAVTAAADRDDEPAAWSVQPGQVPDKHG